MLETCTIMHQSLTPYVFSHVCEVNFIANAFILLVMSKIQRKYNLILFIYKYYLFSKSQFLIK